MPLCRLIAILLTATALTLSAQTPAPEETPQAATLQQDKALLPFHWDAKKGKLYLGIPLTERANTRSAEYIFSHSLPYGIGQNDLGLDRGQIEPLGGGTSVGPRLVYFERIGPKLFLVQPNTDFRTASTDPAEKLAVEQSFPSSVIAGFEIASETSNFVVVDATKFFLRDIHGIAEMLEVAHQGNYSVDESRSTIVPEFTKEFPENTEVENSLTLTTQDTSKASLIADVTPDAHALTIHERFSFLKLPEPGYTPRRYSPRSGYFPASYREMNTPLGEPVTQQFLPRHRLIKKDPTCTDNCEAVQPIHYYIDRGAPEPLRTALLEGCRWWDDAYHAAGWARGTFLVDILPADADPMDSRYNIIQWVHRYNRGWSYGEGVADPRTGEIIKGNVTLGSLRGRQDYLIAESLLAPYKDGKIPDAAHDQALAMVLQRIRQLAAHETGHTLGLEHNYAASTIPHQPDETMSVMEYPHPYVTLDKNGIPDLTHAYPVGIGIWDKVAINYGYREFDKNGHPYEDEAALESILHTAESNHIRYLSDEAARPAGSASPVAHLWDNGVNAADELNRLLTIREAALQRFGPDNIRPGTPTAQLADTLVPLYLLYRYQSEAATKIIGGLDYYYTVRGDGQPEAKIVPAAEQRAAISAVVKTLSPAVLTIPDHILALLSPRAPGTPLTVESFPTHTSLTFDPIATAETAADMELVFLFHPARANRLVEYHARDNSLPTLGEVIDAALKSASSSQATGLEPAVGTAVTSRICEALFRLAANPETSFEARAIVESKLHALSLQQPATPVGEALKHRIEEFEHAPEKFQPAHPLEIPPGMPIGSDED